MLTDIKLVQAQLSKITHIAGLLGKTLRNLRKKLLDLVVTLTKDVLPKLTTKATSFVLDKFDEKISGQGAVRGGKAFTLFISNKDMDDIKIVESLEKSGLLIDGSTETVKHEFKKQKGGFLGPMMAPMVTSLMTPLAFSLIQPVDSLLINGITGKGQGDGLLPLLALPLMIKATSGKKIRRAGRYNDTNKNF